MRAKSSKQRCPALCILKLIKVKYRDNINFEFFTFVFLEGLD